MNHIPLADVGQKLPELLEKVEQGESFAITRDGETIATITPQPRKFKNKTDDPKWQAAYRRMTARLDKGANLGGLRINRDEFYGRDDEKIIA